LEVYSNSLVEPNGLFFTFLLSLQNIPVWTFGRKRNVRNLKDVNLGSGEAVVIFHYSLTIYGHGD